MQSPFSDILHTNYAPTASESLRIRLFCSKPAAKLERLNAEISKLQEALDSLTRQRDEIQEVVESHRALLSHIRQIPVEILQRIFVLCLHSKRNPVMHHSEAPLLLGRICSKWRSIAMGTAELWTSIHIAIPPGSPTSQVEATSHFNAEHVVAWLKRSGALPVNVSLYTPPPPGWGHLLLEAHVVPGTFLDVILPYASRWKSIDLQIPHKSMASFAELQSKDVPLLETFTFLDNNFAWGGPDNENEAWQTAYKAPLTFLATAQKLRRFTSRSPHIVGLKSVVLPWQQLSEISLHASNGMHIDDLLDLLRSCHLLQKCTFNYTRDQSPQRTVQHIAERSITLHSLHSLTIHYAGMIGPEGGRSTMIDYLTVPNLLDLEVGSGKGNSLSLTATIGLISRSSCTLKTLSIGEQDYYDADELLECLKLTPDLDELHIGPNFSMAGGLRALEDTQTTLEGLTIRSDTPPLCPRLQRVVLGNLHPSDISSLLTFLRSRLYPRPTSALLASADFAFNHPLRSHQLGDILKLAFGGVKINIDSPPRQTHNYWEGLPRNSDHL